MNQNKKIISLITAVFSVFAILLVFVYLGNLKKTNTSTEKSNLEANIPVVDGQKNQEQVETKGSIDSPESTEKEQGEVFDGILLKKLGDKIVIKKDDNGDELEFYINQETKITLLELSLKDSTKKDTEFKGSGLITLNEVVEGDSLSVIITKSKDGKNLYIANEIKKIVLLFEN